MPQYRACKLNGPPAGKPCRVSAALAKDVARKRGCGVRTSCIRLRANSRLAILFEDYLEICNGDMLEALLLAILVYWTDIKLAKKDTNLWIWKSHQDFQEDLMVDKPGMK